LGEWVGNCAWSGQMCKIVPCTSVPMKGKPANTIPLALRNSLHAARKQPLGPSCNRLYPRPEAEVGKQGRVEKPLSRTLRLRRSRRRCNEREGRGQEIIAMAGLRSH
jgi:hypothetical protein